MARHAVECEEGRSTRDGPWRHVTDWFRGTDDPGEGSRRGRGHRRVASRSLEFALDAKGGAYRGRITPSNDLWAALVDEPMAWLPECAMPIWKLKKAGSAIDNENCQG